MIETILFALWENRANLKLIINKVVEVLSWTGCLVICLKMVNSSPFCILIVRPTYCFERR